MKPNLPLSSKGIKTAAGYQELDTTAKGLQEKPTWNKGDEHVELRKYNKRRPKKLSSRLTMYTRRIHLFSGLFMLPWVLLYGFTALLFNHPSYLASSDTQIEYFTLPAAAAKKMPLADDLAKAAVESATENLKANDIRQTIQLAESPKATFTRQISGSVENDERSVSVILNLNNGKGYLRNRTKKVSDGKRSESGEMKTSKKLEDQLELSLSQDPLAQFRVCTKDLLAPYEMESEQLNPRSMPNVEFDAVVDGELVRMRLSQKRSRGRRPSGPLDGSDSSGAKMNPVYESALSIVGQAPRDLSARSFLLRLHMAHGYGVQVNSRWFWAVAVDLMFASMCFWGLSGVVMWWQIKRTRKLGITILVASAIVATWLAIGMHWQIVNG